MSTQGTSPEYVIDRLMPQDYNRGFLDLLEQLTTVEKDMICYDTFVNRLSQINTSVYVVRKGEEIVATASLFITKRFIHNLGSVGHIEDVVVDKNHRGQGLGQLIINFLVEKAKEAKCYKIILDCSESNVPFYRTCGFSVKELQMVQYL